MDERPILRPRNHPLRATLVAIAVSGMGRKAAGRYAGDEGLLSARGRH
jgi:hypothetical protein